jgi:hypothetical protein
VDGRVVSTAQHNTTHPTPATTTSRSTGRWINTPQCHHLNVPHNTNRQSPRPSMHQILRFHVIPKLVITGTVTTTFIQDFNKRHKYCVTYTQVQWSVFDFTVIRILLVTSILTTTLIKILITDVDSKCLLHPSAVISVRSNVCVRPEDGHNMSRNMSPM